MSCEQLMGNLDAIGSLLVLISVTFSAWREPSQTDSEFNQ